MRPENLQYLEINRVHLDMLTRCNRIKNLSVKAMRNVMVQEFDKNYGPVDDLDFDQVANLIKDIYKHYDQWKIANGK